MRKLIYEQRGQALTLVAIALVVLIGFTGLVIDGGRLYIAKAKLQKAVDAGALAGADDMLKGIQTSGSYNYTDSQTNAINMANTNYSNSNISYSATFPGNTNVIQVNGQETVPLLLMPVFGMKSTTVSALSQVGVGKLKSVYTGGVIPIGIELNQPLSYGSVWNLTDSPGAGVNGWYNFLDFSSIDPHPTQGTGNNALGYYISSGSPAPITAPESINVQNGVGISDNVKTAISNRVGTVVYVPVVIPDPNQNNKVIVQGFAAFQFINYDKSTHMIQAKFIETVTAGDMGSGESQYGTYASKLIK